MSHADAGVGQQRQILARGPVQPRMMIEEDGVSDNGAPPEHAGIAHELDGSFAVAALHLVKLGNTLGGVGLPRQAALLGEVIGVA